MCENGGNNLQLSSTMKDLQTLKSCNDFARLLVFSKRVGEDLHLFTIFRLCAYLESGLAQMQ